MHHKRVDKAMTGAVITGRVEQGAVMPNEEVRFIPTHTASMACEGKVFTVEMHHKRVDKAMTGDIPGELKPGYSPIGFVRTGRSACKLTKIDWKMGKETGGKKMEDPVSLKSNEVAQCVFAPIQPFVCETFDKCEGLSRIAFLDGNTAVMLGKIVKVEFK